MNEETIVTDEVIEEGSDIQDEADNSVPDEVEPEDFEEEQGDDEEQQGEDKGETEKPFEIPEGLKEIPEGFIKEFIKDSEADLSSPFVQKAINKAYNSEKQMNQVQNELNKTRKEQEDSKIKDQEAEIQQLDRNLQEKYWGKKNAIENETNYYSSLLDQVLETGQPIQWYDGRMYQVTPENQQIFRNQLARDNANAMQNLNSGFNQKNQELTAKKQTKAKEDSSRGYSKYRESESITAKITETPEIADVIEFMQNGYTFDEESCNAAIEVVEKIINKAVTRKISQKQLKKDADEQKKKMSSTAGKSGPSSKNNSSNVDLTKLATENPAEFKKRYC